LRRGSGEPEPNRGPRRTVPRLDRVATHVHQRVGPLVLLLSHGDPAGGHVLHGGRHGSRHELLAGQSDERTARCCAPRRSRTACSAI
jgi:hypothetical protein